MSLAERPRDLLSVEQALERILATVKVLQPERVPLLDALGRVLAEEIVADRDIPPVDNSAMDGFAVRGRDLAGDACARLRIVDDIRAGRVSGISVGAGQAVRITTGAPVPAGADTVVRFEDTRAEGRWLEVVIAPPVGSNVRAAGEDVRAGQAVLRPGKVLRPQEIGMLAALGKTEVCAIRRPTVAVLPTGDEIVRPDRSPGPAQIRDSNSYTIAAQVKRYGGVPVVLEVTPDEEALVRCGVRHALELGVDLIITSGGVSVGNFDLVKQALAAEGEMRFWSLNMKPGRPMAFGVVAGVPLLGLPGNPVAAMISTELFGRPAILKMQGFSDWSRPRLEARLSEAIERTDGRRHYLRVWLRKGPDGLEAELTGDQGSGILRSLVEADGLAILSEDRCEFPAGTLVPVIPLD